MEKITYDPNEHAGLIFVDGKEFIIADAEKAALHDIPLEQRKEIARQSKICLTLLIAGGQGGILVNVDSEGAQISIEGLQRGIALLKLEEEGEEVQ